MICQVRKIALEGQRKWPAYSFVCRTMHGAFPSASNETDESPTTVGTSKATEDRIEAAPASSRRSWIKSPGRDRHP
jgi:hypothetical protein